MLGVVLWSNVDEQKAVIWCEDHGDLAFYNRPEDGRKVSLDAGDWVQFDLTTDRHLRLAHNPRLISEGLYAGLVESLDGRDGPRSRDRGPAAQKPATAQAGGTAGRSAQIIPISAFRAARDRDADKVRTAAVTA